MALHESVFDF